VENKSVWLKNGQVFLFEDSHHEKMASNIIIFGKQWSFPGLILDGSFWLFLNQSCYYYNIFSRSKVGFSILLLVYERKHSFDFHSRERTFFYILIYFFSKNDLVFREKLGLTIFGFLPKNF